MFEKMVARDGIGLSVGVDNTEVIDSYRGEKAENGHKTGSAVQKRYKTATPISGAKSGVF